MIRTIDLVLHDWRNMPPEERQQALKDVTELAARHEGRRARALNIMVSFFHFLTEQPEGKAPP
jgi:hypothetical protein